MCTHIHMGLQGILWWVITEGFLADNESLLAQTSIRCTAFPDNYPTNFSPGKINEPFKGCWKLQNKQCLLGYSGLAVWGLPGLSRKGYHISDHFLCGWTYSSSFEGHNFWNSVSLFFPTCLPSCNLKAMKPKSWKLLIAPFSFIEQKNWWGLWLGLPGSSRPVYLAQGDWRPH